MKRGWVYFTEVTSIPDADLRTMDLLWRAASAGRYGYSVQRELWLQSRRQWPKFFKAIDWVQGENNVYRWARGAGAGALGLRPFFLLFCTLLFGLTAISGN